MADRNLTCPVDQSRLVMSARQGIEIDYCPTCRGVWLDRGELNKIIERSQAPGGANAPVAPEQAAPVPQPPAPPQAPAPAPAPAPAAPSQGFTQNPLPGQAGFTQHNPPPAQGGFTQNPPPGQGFHQAPPPGQGGFTQNPPHQGGPWQPNPGGYPPGYGGPQPGYGGQGFRGGHFYGDDYHKGHGYGRKRRKSFLEELFDV